MSLGMRDLPAIKVVFLIGIKRLIFKWLNPLIVKLSGRVIYGNLIK